MIPSDTLTATLNTMNKRMEVLVRASDSLRRQRDLRASMQAIEQKRISKRKPLRVPEPYIPTQKQSPQQSSHYELKAKTRENAERDLVKEREVARAIRRQDLEEAEAVERKISPRAHHRPLKGPHDYSRAILRMRKQLHRRHVVTGQLFSMMDRNRDDKISYKEFKRGVAMSGMRPVPVDSEMRALFDSFDQDDTQRISYKEMLAGLGAEARGGRGWDHDAARGVPKRRKDPLAHGLGRGEKAKAGIQSNWLVKAFQMLGPGTVWKGEMSYDGRREHNYRIEIDKSPCTQVTNGMLKGRHIGLGQKQPVRIWLKDSGYGPFIQVTVSDNETVLKGKHFLLYFPALFFFFSLVSTISFQSSSLFFSCNHSVANAHPNLQGLSTSLNVSSKAR